MRILPKTILLLGSGELGKEIAIAAQRLGCKVIACDRYPNAPAMQVADVAEVLDMNDGNKLKDIIFKRKPDIIVPEIEAIDVETLIEIEKKGVKVIPNAQATAITMNRDKIRNLASKELKLKTAKFEYANNKIELEEKSNYFQYPLIIKPIMSSSGKGQSLVKTKKDLIKGWDFAMEASRGHSNCVIIEEFIEFDFEITLLTIRQENGPTLFCDPIGHEQANGDYQCSWQPAKMKQPLLEEAKQMAKQVTDKLGGFGIFGVEFFIRGEEVIFSELSPRPHDTGLVTIITQNLNEFELHIRAILGLPIPKIIRKEAGASRVILAESIMDSINYEGVDKALNYEGTQLFLFGKPSAKENRRMGVVLATGEDINHAKQKADKSASLVTLINSKNKTNG
ncbi:formate-dependent phosphoribosylglycinamide formyltransferase [Prochlorococcus sp. MIT 1223]|uniref:formate-dependent phosphoribosylglycinamide formyltransferase n=1 Tax=Prochlorococcus sp. MIT 1223 TaxID=3096217 RepID=UPI0039C3A85D